MSKQLGYHYTAQIAFWVVLGISGLILKIFSLKEKRFFMLSISVITLFTLTNLVQGLATPDLNRFGIPSWLFTAKQAPFYRYDLENLKSLIIAMPPNSHITIRLRLLINTTQIFVKNSITYIEYYNRILIIFSQKKNIIELEDFFIFLISFFNTEFFS